MKPHVAAGQRCSGWHMTVVFDIFPRIPANMEPDELDWMRDRLLAISPPEIEVPRFADRGEPHSAMSFPRDEIECQPA